MDDRSFPRVRLPLLLTIIIGALSYTSIYIARLNFTVASPTLEAMGVLDKAQIGCIGSIFSFSYAIFKVPGGFIGDKYSTNAVMCIGLLIVCTANTVIFLFPVFTVIAVMWGFNAIGQSMLWGPLMRSFSENLEKHFFDTLNQYLSATIALGSIVGLLVAGLCLNTWGVRTCFLVPSIVSAVMAVSVRLMFFDAPGHRGKGSRGFVETVTDMFRMRDFRRMIFPAMAHGMIKDNINVWLALYFVDVYGVDIKAVAGCVFFIPAFSLLGKMGYPMLYKKLGDAYKVSGLAFIVCAAASFVVCTGALPMAPAMACLGIVAAFIASINTHMLAGFPAEVAKDNNLSFASSIMDLLTYGGAGLGSLVFGVLIHRFGYGSMFILWAIGSVLASVVMFRMMSEKSKCVTEPYAKE